MALCNEVLTAEGEKKYVCEHEAFQEHTHGDLMPYMRPLRPDETVVTKDDCLFVAPAEPRIVFFVMQTETNEDGEYRALIAREGEKGYYRTDWFWGTDYELATKIANERNAVMGIDEKEANLIQLRTMRW